MITSITLSLLLSNLTFAQTNTQINEVKCTALADSILGDEGFGSFSRLKENVKKVENKDGSYHFELDMKEMGKKQVDVKKNSLAFTQTMPSGKYVMSLFFDNNCKVMRASSTGTSMGNNAVADEKICSDLNVRAKKGLERTFTVAEQNAYSMFCNKYFATATGAGAPTVGSGRPSGGK